MRKYLELFPDGFDETLEEKIKPENWPYVGYSPSEGFAYTIIPNEEKDMWIITAIELKDISNCTYNMVDLGLPSGLKWADRNVGATSPEHYGSYFQWGDTNAYTYNESVEITTEQLVDIFKSFNPAITEDYVKYILDSQGVTGNDLRDFMKTWGRGVTSINKEFNWDSYFDTTDDGSTFNKYNNNGGLTILESSDDAATVHMGLQYRMPTKDEIIELINNTTQTFIDIDGNEYSKEQAQNRVIERKKLKGIRFASSNGNSIFIPAAGSWDKSLLYDDIGEGCILWSSSLDGNDHDARSLRFYYDGNYAVDSRYRYYGQSVRGVRA